MKAINISYCTDNAFLAYDLMPLPITHPKQMLLRQAVSEAWRCNEIEAVQAMLHRSR